MSNPSPKYGITDGTRKPITIACNDLSQAINALDRLHAESSGAVATNRDALRVTLDQLPEGDETRQKGERASGNLAAAEMRLRMERTKVLGPMLAMREALVDAVLEADTLLPDKSGQRTMGSAHVEPGPGTAPPVAVGGIERGVAERVRVLGETLRWAREETLSCCIQALGPLYTLGRLIEHPTKEASRLREHARAVEQTARTLVDELGKGDL